MTVIKDSAIQKLLIRIAKQGLLIRSVFHLAPDDPVQPVGIEKPAETLLLVGNAGSSLWPVFSQSEEYVDGLPDPLDRWSARIGLQLADEFGALALFPFGGSPYHPFLSWARRGESGCVSPLGLTLHPEYGLWHAYRFALAFSQSLDINEFIEVDEWQAEERLKAEAADLCLLCVKQSGDKTPCLTSCPVDAFTGSEYRVMDCVGFLDQQPRHECNQQGCRARRTCPVGAEYHYDEQHARFHMRQFVANHIDKD